MLIIARATGVQTVVMKGNIVRHESYDSVLVRTGKQKGQPLSENHEWRRRCEVERQVVPETGNARLPTV